MVIGGYASFKLKKLGKTRYPTSGPTWDIELLSEKSNEACSKAVQGYQGRGFKIDGIIEREGDAIGMTGQFIKEAPIFCGGKNYNENLKSCFEFDASINT